MSERPRFMELSWREGDYNNTQYLNDNVPRGYEVIRWETRDRWNHTVTLERKSIT